MDENPQIEEQHTAAEEAAYEHKEKNRIDDILAERGSRYGSFKDHARITQQLKAMMMQGQSFRNMTASQWEALEMIAHKIGRIVNGDPNYEDSWDDIAGYAKLVADELRGDIK